MVEEAEEDHPGFLAGEGAEAGRWASTIVEAQVVVVEAVASNVGRAKEAEEVAVVMGSASKEVWVEREAAKEDSRRLLLATSHSLVVEGAEEDQEMVCTVVVEAEEIARLRSQAEKSVVEEEVAEAVVQRWREVAQGVAKEDPGVEEDEKVEVQGVESCKTVVAVVGLEAVAAMDSQEAVAGRGCDDGRLAR